MVKQNILVIMKGILDVMHLVTLFMWNIGRKLSFHTCNEINTNQNLKKEMFGRWIEYNKAQETYILNQ